MSNPITVDTESLTADGQFASIRLKAPTFNLSISGTWAGTLTLQRSFDDGQNWEDVADYTANTQLVGDDPEKAIHYRIGFKAGGYTSGTAVVRLSQ